MERRENETITIDLKRMLLVLWQRIWLIGLAGAICASAAFCYAWFGITPAYSASTQMYVNNNYVDSPGFSSSQLMAAQDLAKTYMVILESRSVLDLVAEKTNLGYSYKQLKSMVSAASVNETEVFEVTVTGADYKHVTVIANAIAEVLPDKIAAVVEGSSVRVVDYAVENPNPVGPSYEKYLLLGAAAGMVLSVALVVVVDLTDTSIKSEEYLIQAYSKFPLLAVIPDSQSSGSSYKKGYYRGYYENEQQRKQRKNAEQPKQKDSQKGGSV